jgi:hypothetical protein
MLNSWTLFDREVNINLRVHFYMREDDNPEKSC